MAITTWDTAPRGNWEKMRRRTATGGRMTLQKPTLTAVKTMPPTRRILMMRWTYTPLVKVPLHVVNLKEADTCRHEMSIAV